MEGGEMVDRRIHGKVVRWKFMIMVQKYKGRFIHRASMTNFAKATRQFCNFMPTIYPIIFLVWKLRVHLHLYRPPTSEIISFFQLYFCFIPFILPLKFIIHATWGRKCSLAREIFSLQAEDWKFFLVKYDSYRPVIERECFEIREFRNFILAW